MKRQFWKAAWFTFEKEFVDNMRQLGEVSSNAAKDLMNYPPHTWVRAYLGGRCKSWVVDNNMVESFNAWILKAIYMPIRTMLEFIRNKTMNRLGMKCTFCEKLINSFSPTCNEIFQINKGILMDCQVLFNGNTSYEIQEGDGIHTVDLDKNTCTCRA